MLNRPLVLIFAALLGTAACTDSNTPPPGDATTMALGERIYRTNCNTCHQGEGQGMPGVFPPLTGEWVTGDKGRLIRLTLNGLNGPITVHEVEYNNVMTPHDFLSDDQIAAVLTYIRQHFGNQASVVTPEEVAAVRAANTHEGMWTAEALENATGIPTE